VIDLVCSQPHKEIPMSMTDPEKEYETPEGETPEGGYPHDGGEAPEGEPYGADPYGGTPDYSHDGGGTPEGGDGNEAGELAGDELASIETFMQNLTACMDPLPLPDDLLGTLADVMGKAAVIEAAAVGLAGESLAAALAAFFAPEVIPAVIAAGITVYLGRLLGCAGSAAYKEVA
jgi:hypothetical protein